MKFTIKSEFRDPEITPGGVKNGPWMTSIQDLQSP